MEYIKIPLKKEFSIHKIVSFHYFEFAKDFIFNGESHNFWEFLYVDKGEIEVMSDTCGYKLKQGDIIFHKPNEFHSVWANRKIAPNIIILSFECLSLSMNYFKDKILKINDTERNILGEIVKEAFNAYSIPHNQFYKDIQKNTNALFGSEQLISNYLELLLVKLVRKDAVPDKVSKLSTTAKERSEEDIVNRIIVHMRENITINLSIEDICCYIKIGKTHVLTIFKKRTGLGIMEYFKKAKVEHAKTLIRDGNNNLTEIADILGYSSIHCFSRHFKNVTDMSPSEYSRSIKARTVQ